MVTPLPWPCSSMPPMDEGRALWVQPDPPNPGSRTISPSLEFFPSTYVEPLKPDLLFPQSQPLEVELGSGDGSFLVQYARQHPERNFLGVERLLGRLRKTDRKGLRAGLVNLRLLRIEAGYFLEYMLPEHSVAVLHLYFPDPWPKRRHLRRRLVNPHFVEVAARRLQPAGCVYFRTDEASYFEQVSEVFGASAAFCRVETPAELLAVATDFERGFVAQGLAIHRAAYRRREPDHLSPCSGVL